ncbi:MAG: ImmA/IrrE family metallo-endopeptidase [Chloroflexi bacterium]|nr:ImmA/IrrE family metallo-endopeptidase [Chloroflexota bacterium]
MRATALTGRPRSSTERSRHSDEPSRSSKPVRWLPDPTGRFTQRPYYDQGELDVICEGVITDFLIARHGRVSFPIDTNDLTVLLERDAEHLDLYADLSEEHGDVEGVTDFYPGQKPRVRIASTLSEDPRREHRLRTTLTHEYGHVHLHNFLYSLERPRPMFAEFTPLLSPTCKRETMLQAPKSDWMEWQAGYACGSLLIPITALRDLMRDLTVELGLYGSPTADSSDGQAVMGAVSRRFQVSVDAARVRLSQLNYLTMGHRTAILHFD